MINTSYLLTLVTVHFVGDWWCQSREMAHKKSVNMKVLFKHLCIVTGVLAIPVLAVVPCRWYLLIVNAIIHGLIDWNIWKDYKYDITCKFPCDIVAQNAYEYWKDKRFYDIIAVDQFLHFSTIFLLFT